MQESRIEKFFSFLMCFTIGALLAILIATLILCLIKGTQQNFNENKKWETLVEDYYNGCEHDFVINSVGKDAICRKCYNTFTIEELKSIKEFEKTDVKE